MAKKHKKTEELAKELQSKPIIPSEMFGEVTNLEPNIVSEIIEEYPQQAIMAKAKEPHPFEESEEFKINPQQYDALIKSHLELKQKMFKLQQEVITLKFTTYSTEYKGKYWTWYDEGDNKTWIQEFDNDDVLGYVGKLTNAEVLKEYLNE